MSYYQSNYHPRYPSQVLSSPTSLGANHYRPYYLPAKQSQNSLPKVRQRRHSKNSGMIPDELEEFQKLSDRYSSAPDLPGPLVGSKLPISTLVAEYAQADPTYVAKTTALAHTHSAYRPIKGDGQCGWRATVFGYFEMLLNSGNSILVEQEFVRLRSFEDSMKMIGLDYDLIKDMFDATWELLLNIQTAVQKGDKDESVVLDFMNDEIQSNSIVYHFKMMTSAHMKLNEHMYEPFLEMTVEEYRLSRIDPTHQEIDQIGLQALTDAVIVPSGLGLEVLYLDRSTGAEVTPHSFSQNVSGPTLYLLYRPGHYDIIYKNNAQSVQVFLLPHQQIRGRSSQSVQQEDWRDHASFITGGDFYGNSGYTQEDPWNVMQHNQAQHAQAQRFMPAPVPSVYDNLWSFGSPVQHTMVPYGMMNPHYTAEPPPMTMPPATMAIQAGSAGLPNSQSSPSTTVSTPSITQQTAQNEPQIRMTQQMYQMGRHQSVSFDLQQSSPTAQQTTNHFMNDDFQPHMWRPDEDYNTGR